MVQNPKSKIPKIRPKKLGFWILGILDFRFWILGILDFGILGILDCGDFGFWILVILDFGFLEHYVADLYVQSLDFGIWGFWIFGTLCSRSLCAKFGFWNLGILDFGFWGFWGFWGGPGDVPLGNLVTVPGGQRLESPLVCLSGATSPPNCI